MILSLSGDGNVLEPENKDIASVGSGSVFALASARALYDNTSMTAEEIVKKSMEIAGNMCIYTNHNLSIEKIVLKDEKKAEKKTLKKDNKSIIKNKKVNSKKIDKSGSKKKSKK